MEQRNQERQEYAIGQQDFKYIRENDCLYVDKTQYIEYFIRRKMQYLFLARPRRFGKSLFLSTLRYFFEGRRELFKGLSIETMDWDWAEYPVLYLDLNTERFAAPEDLDQVLEEHFRRWEALYEVDVHDLGYSQRFRSIIRRAHEKTGRPVVVLVDEYDKALTNNLDEEEQFEFFRNRLAAIYSNFKSSAEHLRLVFLTGISRFGKLSVFSDINNLKDITFNDDFADICGITEQEFHRYLKPGIVRFSDAEELSYEEACAELKLNYDGYRFARKGSDIYNPWSLLSAMQDSAIDDYWVRTGTPTLVAKVLRKSNVNLEKILNTECRLSLLQGLDMSNAEPLAMLYQTGYLTIKDYDKVTKLYRLGIPNQEVMRGLFTELLPLYTDVTKEDVKTVVNDIVIYMLKGEPSKMMESIDIFLSGIPYGMKMENENNFHNAIYIILRLIGAQVETEVQTSDGRIDLVLKTSRYLYIIELKFGKESEAAIEQIEAKHYARPYSHDRRDIFLIGANFNPSTRHLDMPLIKKFEN